MWIHIPAFAGMTGPWGTRETGYARLWRYRAEWIPAYAGMTARDGGALGLGERRRRNGHVRRVYAILVAYDGEFGGRRWRPKRNGQPN